MEEKNRYIKQGLTIFISLGAVVLLYEIFENAKTVESFFATIKSAIQPIVIGLILAYLLSPIQYQIEKFLLKHRLKKKIARILSVFITAFSLLFICILAIWLLVPRIITTIMELSDSLPNMLNSFVEQIELLLNKNSQFMEFTEEAVQKFSDWITNWKQTGVYDTLNSLVSGILNAVGLIINIAIGFIVMIYFLFEKDRFCGQAKKILYAVSKNRNVNAFILDTIRQCDKMFGGFISGKVIDSIIIGIICAIGLWFLDMPFISLISLIIGVTNVIPFFGPYIGAIPSALLIMLVNPLKCIEFLVFIFILQQVDGNIIGPKILGQSTGLSPFWVLFSILFFGELFGVIGMIIGVPLLGTIYYVIKRLVEASLLKQELPSDTDNYIDLDKLDQNNRATFLNHSETKRRLHRRKKEKNGKESKSENEKKDES